MKNTTAILLLFFAVHAPAQNAKKLDLKTTLLQQLQTTHNIKEWFVPLNIALEGVTPAQARWTDASGNHSIGQLAHHLAFWNLQQLLNFKKLPAPKFSGNNDETFNNFDSTQWKETVTRLDSVLTAIEKEIEISDDARLQSWYKSISNISTHNAYHAGQIIYLRKLQGSWDPAKGVK